jgi:hypothetical protein
LNDFATTNNKLTSYNDDDSPVWKGKEEFSMDFDNISDLRSLRNMFCSNEVMTKTLNTDSNGNYDCGSPYNNLIKEFDEENVMMDLGSTL